ncbi:hypothetical protein [Ruminococcus sp.]
MRYKDFYVRITPDKSIQRVDKMGNEILCDGFMIRIFADENEQIEIDNFSAAVGFEILENSLAEAEQFAKDFIDCENKIYQIDSNPIVT